MDCKRSTAEDFDADPDERDEQEDFDDDDDRDSEDDNSNIGEQALKSHYGKMNEMY